MINPEQLAICKQRGHDPRGYENVWEQCKHCGMWSRTIKVVEEREDDPPDTEMHPLERLRRGPGGAELRTIRKLNG